MNIRTTLTIQAGGPGSGCQGPNCGRPSTGGEHHEFQTWYHGTLDTSAAKIFQQGLKPKEDYKFVNLWSSDDDTKGYIYLTKDRHFAELIANYRAELSQRGQDKQGYKRIDRGWTTMKQEPPGKAAIVTLELPQKIVAKLERDPDAGGDTEDIITEKMYKGEIPKQYVTNVESLNRDGSWRQELARHRIGAAATQKVYLIYYGPIAHLKKHIGVS